MLSWDRRKGGRYRSRTLVICSFFRTPLPESFPNRPALPAERLTRKEQNPGRQNQSAATTLKKSSVFRLLVLLVAQSTTSFRQCRNSTSVVACGALSFTLCGSWSSGNEPAKGPPGAAASATPPAERAKPAKFFRRKTSLVRPTTVFLSLSGNQDRQKLSGAWKREL